MNLLSQAKSIAKWDGTNNKFKNGEAVLPDSVTDVTDTDLLALGLTKTFTVETGASQETYYLKTLKKIEVDNSDNANDASQQDTSNNDTTYSEVKTVQAGGYLAYCPEGAQFKFTPNQSDEYPVYNANGAYVNTSVAADTELFTQVAGETTAGRLQADYKGKIDSDTFLPQTTGLYLFRRNVKLAGENPANDDYEYSGYYYVATANDTGGQGTYYALQYQATDGDSTNKQRSDYTIAKADLTVEDSGNDGVIDVTPKDTLSLFTAAQKHITNDNLKWYYTAAVADNTETTNIDESVPAMLHAFYDVDDDGIYDRNDIMIDVEIANVGSKAENWAVIAGNTNASTLPTSTEAGTNPNQKWTFYYNNDVEEGDTTARFIDSVTLNKDVTQYAYMAFDFDLNVFMDSVQVSVNENGNETFDTVKDGWAVTNDSTIGHNGATAAKASTTEGTPEIATITWTKN